MPSSGVNSSSIEALIIPHWEPSTIGSNQLHKHSNFFKPIAQAPLPNRLIRNDTVKVSTDTHSETLDISYVQQHQRKQNFIGNRNPNKGGDQSKYTDSAKQVLPSKNIQNGTSPLDDGRHPIFNCPLFKEKSPTERHESVMKSSLCFNCLSSAHKVKQCTSRTSCKVSDCGARHNTLLHGGQVNSVGKPQRSFSTDVDTNGPCGHDNLVISAREKSSKTVLLQIIPVTLHNNGRSHTTYAFLDQGSTCSILSKEMAECLKIPLRHPKEFTLKGINTTTV